MQVSGDLRGLEIPLENVLEESNVMYDLKLLFLPKAVHLLKFTINSSTLDAVERLIGPKHTHTLPPS